MARHKIHLRGETGRRGADVGNKGVKSRPGNLRHPVVGQNGEGLSAPDAAQ